MHKIHYPINLLINRLRKMKQNAKQTKLHCRSNMLQSERLF